MSVTFGKIPGTSNKPPVHLISHGYVGACTVLKPKIDKISFTYRVPTKDENPILENLIGLCAEKGPFQELGKIKDSEYQKKSKYKKRVSLTHPDSGRTILIEANPTLPKNPKPNTKPPAFIRMEFNPARLGLQGIEFLRDQLLQVFFDNHTWGAIAANCSVTRLDVAVDILGVDPGDLLITHTPSKKTKPKKSVRYYSPSGELETIYPAFQKKDQAPVCIYNKNRQLKEIGEAPLYGDSKFTRVEVRLQPKRPIIGLGGIVTNPFDKLSIITPTKPITPPETPHAWNWFLDSCRMRGQQAALSLLSDQDLRNAYAQALKDADQQIWKPGKLWSLWPKTLLGSGLLP